MVAFVGSIGCALQKTLLAMLLGGGQSLIRAMNEYAYTGTYCLVCQPEPHIMQQRCLRKEDGHLLVWMPAVTTELSNSA